MKRRWLKWLWLFPLCLCCWHLLLWYLVVPEMVGGIAANLTKYDNSELLYVGYRIYGSSEWQTKTYIYWTQDELSEVEQHYLNYFRPFTDPRSLSDKWQTLNFIATGSRIFEIGLQIQLLSAGQHNRAQMLIHGYDNDPYSILNVAPNNGTIIIFSHDIFAP